MLRRSLRPETPVAVALLVAGLTMAGCASFRGYPKHPVKSSDQLGRYAHYFTDDVLAAQPADARAYRDEVVIGRLTAMNIVYDEFIRSLRGEYVAGEIGTDTTLIALAGVGTVMTPASTKTILAAVSGGIVGVKQSVDKNLFYQKTLPVLISGMDAHRKTVLARIREGLNQAPAQYPLIQGLLDLEDYFRAGTLDQAVVELTAAAGSKAIEADKKIQGLIQFHYGRDANTDIIRNYWQRDANTIDPAHQQVILDWLKAHPPAGRAAPEHISELLNSQEYAQTRAELARYLSSLPAQPPR